MSAIATRKDAAAVSLKKGDFLVYELTVQGAKVNFTLTDTTDPSDPIELMSDADQPAETLPDVVYRRKWPVSGDTITPRDRDHVMGIIHLKGDTYTHKVTHHHNGQDTVIVDIDYAGKDGEVDQKILNIQISNQFNK